jgi:5-methylcytosine-specific restriction enzyme subunit McrC
LENKDTILVFEYGWLSVGETYNGVKFERMHFEALAHYLTTNLGCAYFSLYHDRVRFCNYVGMIRVAGVTIEVLPKIDRHSANPRLWQGVLLDMLLISLQVKAQTTTYAGVHLRQHSVLETYMHLFLEKTGILMRQGLIKQYRVEEGNQPALKGKLLFNRHLRSNIVHKERFYVGHQVYDRDNIYNALLRETLLCIRRLNVSAAITGKTMKLLNELPECSRVIINPELFERLKYDRKSERYRDALELARIILLNYHPDVKGAHNNTLAIMFDMNYLWESYIHIMLIRGAAQEGRYIVEAQKARPFWNHPSRYPLHLMPDFTVTDTSSGEVLILDTKWKYNSGTSPEDVRQMYAYGNYFGASRRYLLYPDRVTGKVLKEEGSFYEIGTVNLSVSQRCGLLFVDPLSEEKVLDKEIGLSILRECFEKPR